ncbi:hypothetical protein CFN78_10720 [Amycolatopsis antarctica]|uniref:Antitoxin n=1 Tax=Amycolatopsis antarctica TaxID=1854586 RepID=A0A263D5K3_9PSEU|nr:antitoxin [Amycolatopsis antarctica]OZM73318.1 hypothetical protein CFN78_10720 [Amycolatopsis antarctica]
MGINFDDIKNKAQEALGKHGDKAGQGVDKAGEFAKSKFGDHADKIDNATGKAKDYLNKDQQGQGGDAQPPQGGPTPQPPA